MQLGVRPVLIRDEDTLIGLLRGRREAFGWSQAELDDRIGWSPAYTSKVEAPHRRYGRRVFACLSNLLDEWLEGLGLALVLMDRKEAERLCAESHAEEIAEAHPLAYANRQRTGGLVTERRLRLNLTFRRAA